MKPRRVIVILGVTIWALASSALADKPYTIIPLDGLPGETGVPEAWWMNESGLVTGRSGSLPVRWNPGSTTPTLLQGLGPGFTMWPKGVDSAGAVYGYATHFSGGFRPIRWDAGSTSPVELGGLGTNANGNVQGAVTAVGASGLALGRATQYSNGQPVGGDKVVYWTADSTQPTVLHDLGTDPMDMNASGTMVERIFWGYPSYPRARRWSAVTEPQGTMLATFDDPQYSYTYQFPTYANAINDAGVAVGYSSKTTRSSRGDILSEITMGALWQPGSATITAIVGVTSGGTGALLYPAPALLMSLAIHSEGIEELNGRTSRLWSMPVTSGRFRLRSRSTTADRFWARRDTTPTGRGPARP